MKNTAIITLILLMIATTGCAHIGLGKKADAAASADGSFDEQLMAKHRERVGGVLSTPTTQAVEATSVSSGTYVTRKEFEAIKRQVINNTESIEELQRYMNRFESLISEYGIGEIVYVRVGTFDLGSSLLDEKMMKQLDVLAEEAIAGKISIVSIIGSASLCGTDERNRHLSLERARTGKKYLEDKGVVSSVLAVKAVGSTTSFGKFPNNQCVIIGTMIKSK
ncbi:OmpA family protein [Patescibacteria group bacterium]